MVKLGSLLGAAYRLKQRRKRLTHRRAHEGAHDAFARAWMRCTRTRGAAVPLKVRNAVDAARDQADNVELNLSGCATDDVVEDVCAALSEHPCVAKLNLTKSKALTPSSGAALVKLAEDQIRLVLTAPLAPRLDGSMTCRRLHGILGEPRGYGCVRRFKVDGRRIGVHHAQRLKQLERLLDYCNAKLTLRDAFFEQKQDGRPLALSEGRVALPVHDARCAVDVVLAKLKGPHKKDAFADSVALDAFEGYCEQVLVQAKKGVLAPLGKDMVSVAREIVARGAPKPKPPPPPKPPTPEPAVESEEEEEAPANAVQALVDEDLEQKVREQQAQLQELRAQLAAAEAKRPATPPAELESSDESDGDVPYVKAGVPLDETLRRLDEELPPGPSVQELMGSTSNDVELASEVVDIDHDEEIRASPPPPPRPDSPEDRARSYVSALVEAAEAHAHETPGKAQARHAAADEAEASDASDAPEVLNEGLDLSARRLLHLTLPAAINTYAYQTLVALNVSRNRLRALPRDAFGQLEALESLNVSYNLLRKLEFDDGSSLPSTLVRVDASRNLASQVKRAFADCTALKTLLLSHNRIAACDGLEHVSALEELDLAGNRIRACKGLRPLAACALLRGLKLQGCPVETTGGSRALVIGLLPQLTHVDDQPLPRGRAHPIIVNKNHQKELKRLDETHRLSSMDDDDANEERRAKRQAQRASDVRRSLEGTQILKTRNATAKPKKQRNRKSSAEQRKRMARLSEDHRPQDRRSKHVPIEKTQHIFGQPIPDAGPLPQPKKTTPIESSRTGFRRWPAAPVAVVEPAAVPVEVRKATPPSSSVPASPNTESNFERWMEELEAQTLTGAKAVDVVEGLHADERLRPRVAPFVATLHDLGVLHVTPPPESVMIQCVAAPDRLRAAASAWQNATNVANKLRTLVGPRPARVEVEAPPSLPPTPSPPSSESEDEEMPEPTSPIGAHPLAAFARQLESELTRSVEKAPVTSLDHLGASGLTPKATPKTPSVKASPLQTWASTAKDLRETAPMNEATASASLRRTFDAADKETAVEVADAPAPAVVVAESSAPPLDADDVAEIAAMAAASPLSGAASTPVDGGLSLSSGGTLSLGTLIARDAALATPDATDFLSSAMPDAADALFDDALGAAPPPEDTSGDEALARRLASVEADAAGDAAFSESAEDLADAFGAAPSPKAPGDACGAAPSPRASGEGPDLASAFDAPAAPSATSQKSVQDAFGAVSAPQASADLASAFDAAPAAPATSAAVAAPAVASRAEAPVAASRATSATSAARHDGAFSAPKSPRAAAPAPAAAKPRKVSWREGYDETYQRMYYFNMDTGESRWDKPDVPYKAYTDDNASATSSGTGRTSSIGE